MKKLFVTLIAAICFVAPCAAQAEYIPVEINTDLPTTTEALAAEPHVRNIIYMIGDGMGLTHLTMLEIEERYRPNAFDRAQNIALISTYSANNRVTDSAAAGTALATGHKTNNKMLGMLPDGSHCESLLTRARDKGLATGIVVTCALTHATPAAFYAHVDNRNNEAAIAADLAECGFDVLIGGSRDLLHRQPEQGATLAERFAAKGYAVVDTLPDAAAIHSGRLVGACGKYHMPSMLEGRGDFLPQAVGKALEILDANSAGRGFALMVEGSQIDFESHTNTTEGILAEMRDFERAIGVAMDFADTHPGTLVVVCADHETSGMAIPSNNKDFTESESGVQYVYGTGSHTASYVPVYLYGAGAESINGILDNTELSLSLQKLLMN